MNAQRHLTRKDFFFYGKPVPNWWPATCSSYKLKTMRNIKISSFTQVDITSCWGIEQISYRELGDISKALFLFWINIKRERVKSGSGTFDFTYPKNDPSSPSQCQFLDRGKCVKYTRISEVYNMLVIFVFGVLVLLMYPQCTVVEKK